MSYSPKEIKMHLSWPMVLCVEREISLLRALAFPWLGWGFLLWDRGAKPGHCTMCPVFALHCCSPHGQGQGRLCHQSVFSFLHSLLSLLYSRMIQSSLFPLFISPPQKERFVKLLDQLHNSLRIDLSTYRVGEAMAVSGMIGDIELRTAVTMKIRDGDDWSVPSHSSKLIMPLMSDSCSSSMWIASIAQFEYTVGFPSHSPFHRTWMTFSLGISWEFLRISSRNALFKMRYTITFPLCIFP